MAWVNRMLAGFSALVRRTRTELELDEELHAYLEASIDAKVRAGLSREAATRAARLELGNLDVVKEQTRDVGWETQIENIWRDVRYAARALRRSPTFSVVTVVILALGIGANAAIFSVVNAVMLRPLPVEHPDELISLKVVTVDGDESVFSYAAYRQFATEGAAIADVLAASSARPDAITIDGPPESIVYKWVSGNYFSALRLRVALGRTLTAAEDRLPTGPRVAVISDAYWARRFGRDTGVLGRAFRFSGATFSIVGVAQPSFFSDTGGEAPDLWLPMTSRPDAPDYLWHGHSVTWLRLLARRKPDVPTEQARAGFEAIYARIRAEMARGLQTAYRKTILGSRVEVLDASSGSSALRERLSAPLVVLTAIVGLVLLIACANVATLMLARIASRSRQMAVCIAIGASRTRLIRQGLMEVVLLAAAGGSAGLMFALWGTRALTALTSGALPVAIDASPDWRVFLFAVLLSGVTALIVGLLPVLRSARLDPLPELKVSGTRSQTVARILLGRSLVVTQIAVSLVLLLAAGLFTRSLLKLQAIDPGFDADRVLLLLVTPPLDDRFDPELYERLIARAERVPGVDAASLSSTGVFNRGTWGNTITVEGFVARGDSTPRTFVNAVSNKYFTVMRIPVLRGRGFTEFDRSTSPKVALVNDAFVRQFFGQTNPLGKRVGLCSSSPCAVDPANLMAIVGVTKDAKLTNLREGRQPMLYLPSAQHTATLRELEVHTVGDAESVVTTLRRELAAVDPRLATSSPIELREHVNASLVAERLTAKLSALFGLLALALGAIGLYGVIAYMTVQRTSEIGLRIALGADGARVRRLVVRDIVWLVGLGALVGLPVAFAGARLVEHQLYGITAMDPLSVIAALCALAAAALIAGYLPTRRATRIDPLIALRAE